MTERQEDLILVAVPLAVEVVAVVLFFAAAFVWCFIGELQHTGAL